jgi:hypothetical protein
MIEKEFFQMLKDKVREYSLSGHNTIPILPGDLKQFVDWCEVNLSDVFNEKMNNLKEIENQKLKEYHQKIEDLFSSLESAESDEKSNILLSIIDNINYDTCEVDGYKERLLKYADLIRKMVHF